MKRGMTFAAGAVFGLFLGLLAAWLAGGTQVSAVFSPGGGAQIIELIDGAQESVDIEIYVFTSRDVVAALERAKARGVDVRIILERDVISGDNDEIYRELAAKGINVRYASAFYKLTHSKFIIIDGKTVLVGSHNLSNSALYDNREASVIVRDAATAKEFAAAFETDWVLAA